MTAVTGVSGSGKSTLVNDILYKALSRALHDASDTPGAHDRIEGIFEIDKVIDIDQSPIGRTPRSNPADVHQRLQPDPRADVADAGGARARLRAGTLLVQREGRALRGVRGRRADQDRDALPARHLRDVRRLRRQALQPRDAPGALQGQVDRRHPRADRRAGARGVREHPGDRDDLPHARRSRASATSSSGSRRRRCPAARRSASSSPRSWRGGRPAGRCTSSTSRRPACTSTTSRSCWASCAR